ncbi:ATP-binding protein [Streptomyces sp. NPDC019396]|uniref:ATP-binding protein n=1 Tax=Streptomyces sp. NPDC019396 TaxID=3154687 RepID=UPI0033F455F5
MAPELAQKAPAPVRTVQLVAGDLLLTVNPLDGSEIEPCPPGDQTSLSAGSHRAPRRSDTAREEQRHAAQPPEPAGPPAPAVPLLERDEPRERLVRLLGRGRSVRLTGPAGSGRSTLIDQVAEDCANLAPDGVVRLSGHGRTPTELLHELFAAVHDAPLRRPDRTRLLELVREIGAVVVIDDLEFGGSALDELLDATPECAFLVAVTPEVPAPSAESELEEVFLPGLGRGTALELLERMVERPLTDEEANWAGDLWFESEGRPLRFVQAGALLRQRDAQRAPGPDVDDTDGEDGVSDDDNVFAAVHPTPLPGLGDAAAPAPLLASRLSESARETLRFAVALGGEVPHQAHLPALVGDTHADAAIGELKHCGLLTPVGPRYRLAAGVFAQLEAAGYAEGAVDRARTAAQHYAWWAAHPSVVPDRVVAEADAILVSMTLLVQQGGEADAATAVLAARSASPAFAAGLHWTAWERSLRAGQEAARIAGEIAQEAYFHHELGVLALCSGSLERARAELEASIALRGALADKSGTVAGRRALALVSDRARSAAHTADEETPEPREGASASPNRSVALLKPGKGQLPAPSAETLVTHRDQAPSGAAAGRRTILSGARRNALAAGAGALLVAVLGTAVTLTAASDGDQPANRVTNEQPATGDGTDATIEGLIGDQPAGDATPSPSGTDDAAQPADPEPSPETGAGGGASPGPTSTRGGEPSSSGGGTTSGGVGSTSGGGHTSGGTSGSPSPSATGGSGSPSPSGSTSGSPSPSTGGSGSPSPSTAGTTSGSQSTGGVTTGGTTAGTADGGSASGDTGSDGVADADSAETPAA